MEKRLEEEIAVLDKVLPVVVRVHGGVHAELSEVFSAYKKLRAALTEGGDQKGPMDEIMRLTDHLKLPADACDAYKKVYKAFGRLAEFIQENRNVEGF